MDKSSLIFCSVVLVASFAVAAIAIPFASISEAKLAQAKSVVDAKALGKVDLGAFGEVSMIDLATYYAENPPKQEAGSVRKVSFEGC